MNLLFRKLTFLILPIFTLLLLSCKPEPVYKKIQGETQGTTYHITYQTLPRKNFQPEIEKLLAEFDRSLSAYVPESILSKVNRNETDVKLDAYFIAVFNRSKEIYTLTEGAFDITVAPLVNAWGFGPDPLQNADSALIDSLRQYVGMPLVNVEGTTLIKKHPAVKIDVNAIAQGYSADIIANYLVDQGVKNLMVEIGGEIVTKGLNPKSEEWKIGIDKPFDNNFSPGQNLQAIVKISGKGLATSGNYRKFYEKDGQKYVHSIDPHTGYPVKSNLLSVTIVTYDCMTADAMATAIMVMGLERSIVFLNKHPELDAFLIYADEEGNFKTYLTEGMKKMIVP